jgi:hypothetical protein
MKKTIAQLQADKLTRSAQRSVRGSGPYCPEGCNCAWDCSTTGNGYALRQWCVSSCPGGTCSLYMDCW